MNTHTSTFVYAGEESKGALEMWGRPEGDHIIALNASTGALVWRYRTAGQDMPSAAIYQGVLVFANGDFHAYALRAADGSAVWRSELRGLSTMASSNVAANSIIVGLCSGTHYRGSTAALDPRDGKILWQAQYGDCDSSPTVAMSRIFVSGVDGNRTDYGYGARGVVAALDARTGNPLWVYRSMNSGPYTKIGSNERAVAGAYSSGVYFQSIPTSNEMLALSATDGKIRWKLRTAGPVKMSSVVADGRLYFGDTVGLLYTVDAASGKIIRIRMFDEPFSTSPPVVVGRTLFIVAGTKVFALPT